MAASFKGVLGLLRRGLRLIKGRLRIDPYEKYMAVSTNWGNPSISTSGKSKKDMDS